MGILDNYNQYNLWLCSVPKWKKPFLVPKTTPKKRRNTLEHALTHSFFTPIHVTVLCHFLDLLQGVTFLSFWLAYQTLKSLIMILSVQLWFQPSPHGHNKPSSHLTTLGLATAPLLLFIMKFWWYQDFLRNSWHVSSYQSFITAG